MESVVPSTTAHTQEAQQRAGSRSRGSSRPAQAVGEWAGSGERGARICWRREREQSMRAQDARRARRSTVPRGDADHRTTNCGRCWARPARSPRINARAGARGTARLRRPRRILPRSQSKPAKCNRRDHCQPEPTGPHRLPQQNKRPSAWASTETGADRAAWVST